MVEFRIKKDDVMVGVYLNGNKGNVVLASGMPQQLDKYHPLVKQMERLGYNLFVPRYMGTFESDGEFNTNNSIRSIETALKLAKSGKGNELYANNELRWETDKVFLLGFSYGALPSLYQKVDVDKRLLVCPFVSVNFHLEDSKGENVKETFEFLERAYTHLYRFRANDVITDLSNYTNLEPSNEKLFVVIGKNDSSIPSDELEYLKSLYNVEMFEKDGGHSISLSDELLEDLLR